MQIMSLDIFFSINANGFIFSEQPLVSNNIVIIIKNKENMFIRTC